MMIAQDHLRQVAAWSQELDLRESEVARSRTRDMTARVARSFASLFNPVLYPNLVAHLEIKQEEVGALSGISRQNTNRCLNRLEKEGMLRLEYGGITGIMGSEARMWHDADRICSRGYRTSL
jgi:CRP-like cAMP-binding protein